MRRALMTGAVVVLSTVLATLATHAIDFRANLAHSLLGMVLSSRTSPAPCPDGMTLVAGGEGDFCIDRFEASPRRECLFDVPQSTEQSSANLHIDGCAAESKEGSIPWRSVTQAQAKEACTRAGKRLPTPHEWYRAALGTEDLGSASGRLDCQLSKNRGSGTVVAEVNQCVSSVGAYDMVGNSWEWVDATIDTGLYRDRALPESGFVTEVDQFDGMPITTNATSSKMFGHDSAYIDADEPVGLMRGGGFSSGTDGGVYAIYTAKREFAGGGVGFRCVKDITKKTNY